MHRFLAIFIEGAAAALPLMLGAQAAPPRVTWYTVESGLAQNRVYTMAQDHEGFLWFGTPRGLQRFDGRNFILYRDLNPSAPPELSGPILQLAVDRRGRLWAQPPRKLLRLDLEGSKVGRIPVDSIGHWAPDSAGRIWFLSRGSIYTVATDSEPLIPRALKPEHRFQNCNDLATAHDGSIWLVGCAGTDQRAIRYVPATESVQEFPASSNLSIVLEDPRGEPRVWFMAEDGIETCDRHCVGRLGPLHPVSTLAQGDPRGLSLDPEGGVRVLTKDWIAHLDTAGRRMARWAPTEVFKAGAPVALASFRDREGGVWLTTLAQGVARLDFTPPAFVYRASRSRIPLELANDFVTALHESPDGTLWIGTFHGGMYRVSSDWSRTEAFRHDQGRPASLPSDRVWDFEQDARGNLWVSAGSSLCRVLTKGLRCMKVPSDEAADLERDGDVFWIARPKLGVLAFDPRVERFGGSIPGLPSQIDLFGTITLYREAESPYLWIGSDGVFRANVTASHPDSQMAVRWREGARSSAFAFYRDHRARFWAGTDEGLMSLDSLGRLDLVAAPLLRATTVFSIVEDRSGRLWVGTARGLVQYDPDHEVARLYNREDGVLIGEPNRRAALVRRNGRILFGGVEGLLEFDPDSVAGTSAPSPMMLTRWRKVTGEGEEVRWLARSETLRLLPGDRAFTIEFAALSFAPTLGRRYRYRIDGLTPGWIETTQRLANFGTPRPGHYTFRVETATGSGDHWSGAAVTPLDVVPPFWGTNWFRGVVLIALTGLVWAVHRWRLRHALAAERVRLRISRDLHDELGAGLSGIALLSDTVASMGLAGSAKRELHRIGELARRMVEDLRDIVWAIDPDADRFADFITRMRDVADDLLRGIRVHFGAPGPEPVSARVSMTARRELLFIYKELLHNVVKHARATEVRIEFSVRDGRLELVVVDDGIGFSPGGGRSGTGLKSLRERAARLDGTLTLTSATGLGTTARLSIRVT